MRGTSRSRILLIGPALVVAVAIAGPTPGAVARLATGWGLAAGGGWAAVLAHHRARHTGDASWARVARTATLWTAGQVALAATDAAVGAGGTVPSLLFLLAGASAADVVLRSRQMRDASSWAGALDAVGTCAAMGGLLWGPVLGPASEAISAASVAFPMLEVGVAAFGISLLAQSGARDRALVAMVWATGLMAAGDLNYLRAVAHDGYEFGGALDLTWVAAVGVLAMLAGGPEADAAGAPERRRRRWWHYAWPALPLVLLSIEGVRLQVRDGRIPTTVVLCGVSAVLIFVIRQLVLHQEIVALSEALADDRDRLADAEQRSRLLLEHSGDGVIGSDPDGRVVFMNRAAEELLGLGPGEAHGRQGHEVVHTGHPDGSARPAEDCPLGPALARGEAVAADLDWWSRADGTFVPVEYRAQPVLRDGQPGGSVISFRDVRARIDAAEALAGQERRWRSLILNASDVVVVLDDELRIRLTTPSVERVLGFDPAEGLGPEVSAYIHPEDLPGAADDLAWIRSQPGGTVRTAVYRYRHADGRWLRMEATATNLLDDPDVRGIVCNLRDVTDRYVAEELLRHQATHDSLTRLPNRAAVRQWLADRAGHRQAFGFVLLDLDGFKDVNDALGHPAGDELLCRVADRLRTSVRAHDLVGRLGGDEFVAVVPLDDPADLADVAGRLLASLGEPVEIAGWTLTVSASAGGAVGSARDLDEALQQADIAMYRAKQHPGGGAFAVYGTEDEQDRLLDLELTSALRQAIADGDLDVWYQVKVDADSGDSAGAEALARWSHPVHGQVSPATFVPLAERAGLIGPLTDFVLDRVIDQAARWRADGLEVPVAVNVSPLSLRAARFADGVLERLRSAGLPAHLLEVEITEAAVADPTDAVLGNLARLREAGVRVAVDDFGTGYSSLSYLKELPIDILKVDRSFVAGIDAPGPDLEIVRAICALATSLRLAVVAEGVETPTTAAQLRAIGCSVHQGFLYHRPEAPADVTAALARRWRDARATNN